MTYQHGAPVIWFDYEIGEKNHMQGFVCDAHRVSDRVEKLAQLQTQTTIIEKVGNIRAPGKGQKAYQF
jgi:hypothetical protein